MKENIKIKRLQLTLFIPANAAKPIEEIRAKYNPLQDAIIAAHVTLCREDELKAIETVIDNLASLKHSALTIYFEHPTRFADGKGLLIPGSEENDSFHELRKAVLNNVTENPIHHQPHITLMHPRNSVCTDEIFEVVRKIKLPSSIRFDKISLIEQSNGEKWKVLKSFPLK